jgi:hypothetical protein
VSIRIFQSHIFKNEWSQAIYYYSLWSVMRYQRLSNSFYFSSKFSFSSKSQHPLINFTTTLENLTLWEWVHVVWKYDRRLHCPHCCIHIYVAHRVIKTIQYLFEGKKTVWKLKTEKLDFFSSRAL